MNFERLMGSTFYKEVGLVVTLASVMTLVITQIIKIFLLKKSKYQIMSEIKKDEKLSKLGRFVALVCYSVFYIGVEVYLHHSIIVDGALLVSLISGASLTLATAKGIYTSLHQKKKKRRTRNTKQTKISDWETKRRIKNEKNNTKKYKKETRSKKRRKRIIFFRRNKRKKTTKCETL